jgi:hypothetical protein
MDIRHVVYKIPIYFGELHVFICNDSKLVNDKYKLNIPEYMFGAFEAICHQFHKKNGYLRYYIIIRENVTPKIIAHESVHLTNFIFKDRGINLDLDNDEPQAYLHGWIFESIYKLIK